MESLESVRKMSYMKKILYKVVLVLGIVVHNPFPRRNNPKVQSKVIMNLHKAPVLGK